MDTRARQWSDQPKGDREVMSENDEIMPVPIWLRVRTLLSRLSRLSVGRSSSRCRSLCYSTDVKRCKTSDWNWIFNHVAQKSQLFKRTEWSTEKAAREWIKVLNSASENSPGQTVWEFKNGLCLTGKVARKRNAKGKKTEENGLRSTNI